MTAYVALLRAVNVGGTGQLAMRDLRAICQAAGLGNVQTFIASGNAVFASADREEVIKRSLEAKLHTHTGRAVGVLVRTAAGMGAVLGGNPYPDAPGNRVSVIFLDDPTGPDTLDGASGQAEDEEVSLGHREIYVRYGSGMGRSKLRIPAARLGTARNMNTVAKLAEMASMLVISEHS